MKKVIVLGAGLVGRPMALDLAKDPGIQVAVADLSEDRLNAFAGYPAILPVRADCSDEQTVRELVSGYDLVINAVPGYMGYGTLKTVLESGRNCVDIAFSPEDLSGLNSLAVQHGITALVDFGVAPGLSHLMVASHASRLDRLDKVRIYVGGLPKRRTKPFEYTAVFSPIDVIEEYTRPARIIRDGKLVVKEALSDVEELHFSGLGTLEAFNSDGLRSLVSSIEVRDMAEKTLRYPGHAALMRIFRETGFFDQDPVNIKGKMIKPMDLTATLLFPKWEMQPEDRDMTVMKVISEGVSKGENQRFVFDLYDEWEESTGVHSMARTTGYTATMGARLLLEGRFGTPGVYYPEKLGTDEKILDFILEGLRSRGVRMQQFSEII
jgi:saccharopine dehydrogenase-like NADP-dependent oxidoreductase